MHNINSDVEEGNEVGPAVFLLFHLGWSKVVKNHRETKWNEVSEAHEAQLKLVRCRNES